MSYFRLDNEINEKDWHILKTRNEMVEDGEPVVYLTALCGFVYTDELREASLKQAKITDGAITCQNCLVTQQAAEGAPPAERTEQP